MAVLEGSYRNALKSRSTGLAELTLGLERARAPMLARVVANWGGDVAAVDIVLGEDSDKVA